MMRDTLIASTALVRDTFREALARKVFWGLFGLSTAIILFFVFIMHIDVVQGALATVSLFGHVTSGKTDVVKLVRQVHGAIASFLFGLGMFLAVFASAGLIPTIFEPGRIELLLSKPVSRLHILFGRYVGNVLVVALNIAYLVLGVWLIFGWKTGVWNTAFLWVIATTIFMFAVLMSIIILVSVLSESAALATMVTFGVMIVSLILAQRSIAEKLLSSEWSRQLWRALYWALPKLFEAGRLNHELVLGNGWGSPAPLWTSAVFGVIVLAVGLYSFSKRDF